MLSNLMREANADNICWIDYWWLINFDICMSHALRHQSMRTKYKVIMSEIIPQHDLVIKSAPEIILTETWWRIVWRCIYVKIWNSDPSISIILIFLTNTNDGRYCMENNWRNGEGKPVKLHSWKPSDVVEMRWKHP